MSSVIVKCNQLIRDSNPDGYSAISYNKYYRDLANISDIALEERKSLANFIKDNVKDENLCLNILKKILE